MARNIKYLEYMNRVEKQAVWCALILIVGGPSFTVCVAFFTSWAVRSVLAGQLAENSWIPWGIGTLTASTMFAFISLWVAFSIVIALLDQED